MKLSRHRMTAAVLGLVALAALVVVLTGGSTGGTSGRGVAGHPASCAWRAPLVRLNPTGFGAAVYRAQCGRVLR